MGIRFFCPNGHKLNVKERLAGKRGICPNCGVKLLIPHKSTRLSSHEERLQDAKLAGGAGGNPNEFDVFTDDDAAQIAMSFDESFAQTPTQSTVEASVLASAFDEPDVVWYVQFPDGQRYGPATLPILKNWVQERRISPTMLVWREGWQDWLEARLVFPEVEQIFREMDAKIQRRKLVSLEEQQTDTDEETTRISALLIVAIVVTILVFTAILFFIFRP